MWNPFRSKKKKQLKKALQNLRNLHEMVGILDNWARHGLIFWRRKDNILIIEEPVALLKLAEGRKGFLKFLNQIAVWQSSQLIDEAYETHRIKVETEAVRKAQRKFANLTKADIMRIRQEARENLPMLPIEQLDYIKEFDIFVVRASAPSAPDATEESGQLLALGHYDGEKVEMAMYDDIKLNLQSDRNEQSEK